MKELGRFDPDLEMFVKPVQEPDLNHLNEIKWRLDNGKLEGDTAAEVIQLADVRAKLGNINPVEAHVSEHGDY